MCGGIRIRSLISDSINMNGGLWGKDGEEASLVGVVDVWKMIFW